MLFVEQAGNVLHELKKRIAHGEWTKWLKQNVPGMSGRTARRYMRFASNWPRLANLSPPLFSVSEALRHCQKPKQETGEDAKGTQWPKLLRQFRGLAKSVEILRGESPPLPSEAKERAQLKSEITGAVNSLNMILQLLHDTGPSHENG
jgi:hypothetical protein